MSPHFAPVGNCSAQRYLYSISGCSSYWYFCNCKLGCAHKHTIYTISFSSSPFISVPTGVSRPCSLSASTTEKMSIVITALMTSADDVLLMFLSKWLSNQKAFSHCPWIPHIHSPICCVRAVKLNWAEWLLVYREAEVFANTQPTVDYCALSLTCHISCYYEVH